MSDLVPEVAKQLLEVIKEKEQVNSVLDQVRDFIVDYFKKQNQLRWELLLSKLKLPCILYYEYNSFTYHFMFCSTGKIYCETTNQIYNTPSAAVNALRQTETGDTLNANGWDCLHLESENGPTLNEYLDA